MKCCKDTCQLEARTFLADPTNGVSLGLCDEHLQECIDSGAVQWGERMSVTEDQFHAAIRNSKADQRSLN